MQEIDFVLSDLSLEVIGDFAIIWLLSPKKSFGRAPQGGLSHFAAGLPGHTLQASTLHRFSPSLVKIISHRQCCLPELQSMACPLRVTAKRHCSNCDSSGAEPRCVSADWGISPAIQAGIAAAAGSTILCSGLLCQRGWPQPHHPSCESETCSSQNALCVRMQRQRRGTVGSGFMRGAGDHHQQWHMLRCLIQAGRFCCAG